jgi:hypothetical protein
MLLILISVWEEDTINLSFGTVSITQSWGVVSIEEPF